MKPHQPVIIFDFDGTISLGPGPVLSYARNVAHTLPREASADLLAEVEAFLGLDAAKPPATPALIDGHRPIDGYDAVRLLSLRHGVDDAMRGAAYLRSRHELATEAAPIHAPDGLAGFLATIRPQAVLVLATNAPDIRLDAALDSLGLANSFDRIHASMGKPDGFAPLLDRLLNESSPASGHGSSAPEAPALMGVGDVWRNDLAPIDARGGATVLVGDAALPGTGSGIGPTFAAVALTDLYDDIRRWLTKATEVRQAPIAAASTRSI
ncbi:HAD family hydrolase [Paeniglutamicibacter gangotriensis]|uniref:Uncharacterized protein n=1 Tax=Paeniglutamicibacter gangotriensis Lz1y TaxID=1276920 RepID=M7MTW0_9MICC|nr:HAD family hydrolase [Paeniglutamicibacter gangotriensis]EMQ99847.1 hypothetical protein ADIAG_00950 [Paeniglutamicibacter gangotriensis Lz1y]